MVTFSLLYGIAAGVALVKLAEFLGSIIKEINMMMEMEDL